jgi:hypothetical protein
MWYGVCLADASPLLHQHDGVATVHLRVAQSLINNDHRIFSIVCGVLLLYKSCKLFFAEVFFAKHGHLSIQRISAILYASPAKIAAWLNSPGYVAAITTLIEVPEDMPAMQMLLLSMA